MTKLIKISEKKSWIRPCSQNPQD